MRYLLLILLVIIPFITYSSPTMRIQNRGMVTSGLNISLYSFDNDCINPYNPLVIYGEYMHFINDYHIVSSLYFGGFDDYFVKASHQYGLKLGIGYQNFFRRYSLIFTNVNGGFGFNNVYISREKVVPFSIELGYKEFTKMQWAYLSFSVVYSASIDIKREHKVYDNISVTMSMSGMLIK